jgi:hypothetical protein
MAARKPHGIYYVLQTLKIERLLFCELTLFLPCSYALSLDDSSTSSSSYHASDLSLTAFAWFFMDAFDVLTYNTFLSFVFHIHDNRASMQFLIMLQFLPTWMDHSLFTNMCHCISGMFRQRHVVL